MSFEIAKCNLLIRTPEGRLVELGRIRSLNIDRQNNIPLCVPFTYGDLNYIPGDTIYSFSVCEPTGDYDGDEEQEINPIDWENIIKE